jgi:GTP pyrophosphokinase
MTTRLADAFRYATEIHAGQTRKGTAIPYIAHVMGVASIAFSYGADEDEAIAALLHDTIEDAPAAIGAERVRDAIRRQFGERVLAIVEGCTDTDASPKPPWLERKKQYIAHVVAADASTVLVSASDKLHNVSAILADFRQHGDAVWRRFNADAGKRGVIGYYRGLVTAYRRTGHQPRLVSDLHSVVSALEAETGVAGTWPPSSEKL